MMKGMQNHILHIWQRTTILIDLQVKEEFGYLFFIPFSSGQIITMLVSNIYNFPVLQDNKN